MSIYAVIQQNSEGPAGTLDSAIRNAEIPSYPVQPDVWLVSYRGSARELCDLLKVTPDGETGTAVVIEVGSYFGRAQPAIWSWLKSNWEGSPLG